MHARVLHGRRRSERRLPHDQDDAARAAGIAARHLAREHRCRDRLLNAQIEAGAQAVMIFDTWGGSLSGSAYRDASLTYMAEIVSRLTRANATGCAFPSSCSQKAEALGWTRSREPAATSSASTGRRTSEWPGRRIGDRVALQGNLDPAVLFAPPAYRRRGRESARGLWQRARPHLQPGSRRIAAHRSGARACIGPGRPRAEPPLSLTRVETGTPVGRKSYAQQGFRRGPPGRPGASSG